MLRSGSVGLDEPVRRQVDQDTTPGAYAACVLFMDLDFMDLGLDPVQLMSGTDDDVARCHPEGT